MANVSSLLDLGGGQTDLSEVISTQLNLILDIRRSHILHTITKFDLSHTLLSQKVSDLDVIAGQGNVDGEMGVNESHLVQEALGHTSHHVVNVRADGTHSGELFARGKPKIKANEFAPSDLGHIHVDVLEAFHNGSAGSSDRDSAAIDLDLDSLLDGDRSASKDGLHFIILW